MHLQKKLLAVLALSTIVLIFWSTFPLREVSAAKSEELQDQIEQEQQKLAKAAQKLNQAQGKLDDLDSKLDKLTERLPQIELELQIIKIQIAYNKLQLAYLDDANDVAQLKFQQQLELQELLLKSSYSEWKLSKDIERFFPSQKQTNYLKQNYYRNKLMTDQNMGIQQVQEELLQLEVDYNEFAQKLVELDSATQSLKSKRAQLRQELALLKGDKSKLSSEVAGLYSKQETISAIIANLTAAQQDAARREADLIEKKPVPPPPPPTSSKTSSKTSSATSSSTTSNGSSSSATSSTTSSATSSATSSKTSSATSSSSSSVPSGPSFRFKSQGRDYYQGHGVGMSQYGAHGMAQAGLNADEILKKYYKDVDVVDVDLNSHITIKFCEYDPALDAYQNGCADGRAPVTQRVSFNVYLAGLGEMPESWPLEARKAQIIAARTYAMLHTSNGDPSRPICITSYCQVSYIKKGDKGELDLVEDTADLVIKYDGQLIDALYSADNSQGSGTANNDTIFQDFNGNGTPYPYLRAFNDKQWATSTYWTNWACTTNSYTYSDIQKMFVYIANRGQVSSSTKASLKTLLNKIGTVTNLDFQKDPSGRVAKVVVRGTNGNTTMGGWWFKYVWNEWVYATNRTNTNCFGENRYDYIYSQTINMIAN